MAPITEAVFASGHIEAKDQFTLTALNDGYIKDVLVTEGDTVATDQTLFAQDNAAAAIQQQSAAENLDIANQQAAPGSPLLQELQAKLLSASQQLQADKTQLERMQRLYYTHSVAKVDLDNAQLNYDNAANNVAVIRQNLGETTLNLKQTLINSRSQLQTASVNTGYYNVKSPGIYKVYTLLKKKGELVRKGEAVAVLGSVADLKIVLSIDEVSIAKLHLRQKVLIGLNTEKGKTYTGYLTKIYPAFDAASQAYTAEAAFDTSAAGIINGTLLQANIIITRKEKAMLIPRSCLSPDGNVLVKKNKRVDTVAIQTGIISNEWVEVISGLALTDKIEKL
ncbi:efflux RND transporter periplasmic adaptor subunit [Rurimicrobium arvi]|uniref:Efflux RND transporter periplasmic adaptor subunit n=2 Tax=Rurimicrobium arvi TaxID=2049916 RepID=A0ABP8MHC3_9BACT